LIISVLLSRRERKDKREKIKESHFHIDNF
jgi:hypothetical protein